MAYLHAIGTTLENLQTLESLGIKIPEDDFAEETDEFVTGAKTVKAVGPKLTSWHWNFIKRLQRNILKGFCSGKSSWVYIVTPVNNSETNSTEYKTFHCLMVWPTREPQRAERILDFTIRFLFMTEVVEEETS